MRRDQSHIENGRGGKEFGGGGFESTAAITKRADRESYGRGKKKAGIVVLKSL